MAFFATERPVKGALALEAQPGAKVAKLLGVEHVVDWSEMETFFSGRAAQAPVLYFGEAGFGTPELPSNLLSSRSPAAPIWLQPILQKWPTFEAEDATKRLERLMDVQDADEIAALRAAAKVTVPALLAGMRAIRPNVSQRSVETVVESTCWNVGARGISGWPWAMAGENAVIPRPFSSLARYDHLNRTMLPGELVRMDVGCEWDHYGGDLGRTVPVSGHYADDQRETWSIFVAAYHAGAWRSNDILITSGRCRFFLQRERGWTIPQFQRATFHESTSLDFDDRGSGGHGAEWLDLFQNRQPPAISFRFHLE